MSAPGEDDGWPTIPTDWLRRDAPPTLAPPQRDGVKLLPGRDGVKVLDGVRTLVEFKPGDVTVDATAQWALAWWSLPGKDDGAVLLSRKTREKWAVPIRLDFFDSRRLIEAPRWDVDGRHYWLHYPTHWEKHFVPAQGDVALEPLSLAHLPKDVEWKELPGTHGTSFVSGVIPGDQARALWERLTSAQVSAVVCEEELIARRAEDTPVVPFELAGGCSEARATPWEVVLARRERVRLDREVESRRRLLELDAPAEHLESRLAKNRLLLDDWRTHGLPDVDPPSVDAPDLFESEQLVVVASSLPPAELPLVVGFGGFNQCPSATDHATLLREWGRAFGARPMVMTVDSLELLVPRPPTGADAIPLAWAHDLYCAETSELADVVAGCQQRSWFFWWD